MKTSFPSCIAGSRTWERTATINGISLEPCAVLMARTQETHDGLQPSYFGFNPFEYKAVVPHRRIW